MGAFDSWVLAFANIKPGGIASTKIKLTGDNAFYHLGNQSGGKLSKTTPTKTDSFLKPYSWGARIEAVIPSIMASATEIAILDSLVTGANLPITVKLGLMDTLYFESAVLGLKWKLICGANFDDFRKIEYTIAGNMKTTELDGAFTASPTADGTPNVADDLYTLAQSAVTANQKPNGISKIEFKELSGDSYTDIGDIEGAEYTIECKGEEQAGGGRGLYRTTALHFMLKFNALQTAATELGLLDSMLTKETFLKITHMDGAILTLPSSRVHLVPSFDSGVSVDGSRKLPMSCEGTITDLTTWNGLWS